MSNSGMGVLHPALIMGVRKQRPAEIRFGEF